jgi:ABC-type transport system involved in cytochrome c biogenesis permease subunit
MNEMLLTRRSPTGNRSSNAVMTVLSALGSMRLTVFLLSLGIVLVIVGTFQQTRENIFQVKKQHFSAPVVHVPFRDLLIPAWFPDSQNVTGGMMLPSGGAVMIAMLINLLCAHIVRFRIQARGPKLAVGLAVLAAGAAATALVIANGNQGGFQETPIISWHSQWLLIQGSMAAAGAGCLYGAVRASGKVSRVLALISGLGMLGLSTFLFVMGEDAFVGESAMRVLWRLIQAAAAAIICYLGALIVFRRKAGIVVVHTGLLLLMVGELYTTWSAREQRLFFFEGDTTSHTYDVDFAELALIEPVSGQQEKVITVDLNHLNIDGMVDDKRLPVRIRPLGVYRNSAIFRRQPGDRGFDGEKGLATVFRAEVQTPVSGAEANAVNMPSAYVELFHPDRDESLGVFLISTELYQQANFELDQVEVDGKAWKIGLRFRHYYKPYTVTLESTERTNYLGTETPRSYSSRFRIVDPANNTDEVKLVSMNQPLRYNNETFYQSGHDTTSDGRRYSVLQVVQNTGWLIPYVSCGFVAIGLLLHFSGTFVRFIEQLPVLSKREPWSPLSMGMVAIAVASCGGFAWMQYNKASPAAYEELDIAALGRIPVVAGGRVQPLDSAARTLLRKTRDLEIVPDGKGDSQPAIRWLADWIFNEPGADQYLVFRVIDPEIQSALKLPRSKRFMYSFATLSEKIPGESADDGEFDRRKELKRLAAIADEASRRDKSSMTNFQKRVLELEESIQEVENLRLGLSSPFSVPGFDPLDALNITRQLDSAIGIVKALPGEETDSWTVLSTAKARYWLADFARERGINDVNELAAALCSEETRKQLEEAIFDEGLILELSKMAKSEGRQISFEELERIIRNLKAETDPAVRKGFEERRKALQPEIDGAMAVRFPRFLKMVGKEIAEILPADDESRIHWDAIPEAPPLVRLEEHWKQRNAASFNKALADHMQAIAGKPDIVSHGADAAMEDKYNRLSPFYLASVLYVMSALASLISWICMLVANSRPSWQAATTTFGRIALWVLLSGLVLHSAGLWMRISISGRAPVTSLHSSTLFISWACVLLSLFAERILGRGMGSFLGAVFGSLTLAVSTGLATDGDTFSVMVAVLDTQFWLWTHVVIITLGYSATYFSALLGIAWLLLSVFSPVASSSVLKVIASMIYGITCFALLLSFTGTVLGGLWADDSWGRFWGWDPKENGALMIVVANAILLHARWAGLAKDNGMAMIAVFGGIMTTWSWFAVNEMGVGLHQYGLTEGRMMVVGISWLVMAGLMALGWIPLRWRMSSRLAERT